MYVLRDASGSICVVFAIQQSFPTEFVPVDSEELKSWIRKKP